MKLLKEHQGCLNLQEDYVEHQDFVVSPSGYGIHWPDLDEDLSVDGLIGIKHSFPVEVAYVMDSHKKDVRATAH